MIKTNHRNMLILTCLLALNTSVFTLHSQEKKEIKLHPGFEKTSNQPGLKARAKFTGATGTKQRARPGGVESGKEVLVDKKAIKDYKKGKVVRPVDFSALKTNQEAVGKSQQSDNTLKQPKPVDFHALHTDQQALGEEDGVRKVEIVEDLDQIYMCAHIFELKHIQAADLEPFIRGAVLRYNEESTVRRLDYKEKGKQYIVVSTGIDMMPFVKEMIAKLDRPGKLDKNGSIIDGDGIYRFVYYPKNRFFPKLTQLGSVITMDQGAYFQDSEINMYYWKDSKSEGDKVLTWLKALDRPVPQAELKMSVYEINDNDMKELGIDYVSWKNGPGAELFGFGADLMKFKADQQIFGEAVNWFSSFSNSWAGMMFAPQFDASFVRMLAQKGKAKVATSGALTMVNDFNGTYSLKYTPGFQNISKTDLMEISVDDNSSEANFSLIVNNPTICFNKNTKEAALLLFNYTLEMRSVVERNNTGLEFVNQNILQSDISLQTDTEKLLGTFTREHDVSQYNGMPFLGDIPIIKYLVGTQTHSKAYTYVFVTVKATPIAADQNLSDWAGQIISTAELLRVKPKAVPYHLEGGVK